MKRFLAGARALLLLIFAAPGTMMTTGLAQTFTPPAEIRHDTSLADGWRFIKSDVPEAEQVGFDDSSWSVISIPHTWNALDGQDGGNDYYRGPGFYRRHYLYRCK